MNIPSPNQEAPARIIMLACLFYFAVFPHAFGQATIDGTVALPKKRSAPVVTQRYEIVSKGGILSPNPPIAVVYLEGAFPTPTSPPIKQISQKNLNFTPALLAVPVGTKVEFPNEDDTYHNIFSYSPAKRFDLGRYRPDERPIPSVVFDIPGLVTIRCDIHEHMRGLILVLSTPYFTTTDTNGHFRLNGLPPGRYSLKAWLNSKTTHERQIDLKSGEVLHVEFP